MNKIEKEKHLNSALIAKQNIIDDLNEKDNLLSFAFNPFDNEFIGLIVSRKNYDYFITNKGNLLAFKSLFKSDHLQIYAFKSII